MWKITGQTFVLLFLLLSIAYASPTHLEKLKSLYPYGLIGNDYGLLTVEDLAINACNVSNLTPFSGEKNMAYSYWQCFLLKNAKIECDSMGYDSVLKKETAHLEVDALNENGLQSYLARNAMNVRDCKKYLQSWKRKTRGETYICISGSYGGFNGFRDGHKETNWVFDKFKTRKGCESHRSKCNWKEISMDHCLHKIRSKISLIKH